MANTNAPFGLRYIGMAGGAAPNAALQTLKNGILSSNTTKIYSGDLIKIVAAGRIEQWAATNLAAQLWGVFRGCSFASQARSEKRFSKIWPGADAVAGTVDAQFYPGVGALPTEFVIQTDATGIDISAIGANADVTVGAGNDASGFSGMVLNATTSIGDQATKPLRIVDLWANRAPAGSPGTEAGAFNWAVVRLNTAAAGGIA
jgi:hypothetical protein